MMAAIFQTGCDMGRIGQALRGKLPNHVTAASSRSLARPARAFLWPSMVTMAVLVRPRFAASSTAWSICPRRANRRNKASPFITGPFVPVGILNLIRAVVGIPHHRFNLFVKCSSQPAPTNFAASITADIPMTATAWPGNKTAMPRTLK
jgi:hypothetical protein